MTRLTLNLHLVTTTNLSVWSLPRISSLHKMSSWRKKEALVSRVDRHSVCVALVYASRTGLGTGAIDCRPCALISGVAGGREH